MEEIKKGKITIKKNGNYYFRDMGDYFYMPEEAVNELKGKMTYEDAIVCFFNSILDNKRLNDKIDKAIEYIEKCLKQTPTENREKADESLDIEYKYILNLLKGVSECRK